MTKQKLIPTALIGLSLFAIPGAALERPHALPKQTPPPPALTALSLSATRGAALAPPDAGDGMPARGENAHGLSTKKDDSKRARARDRLSNINEYRARTDPRK